MLRFLCFYKVIVAEKACSNIYRFDIPFTCTGDQNLTVLRIIPTPWEVTLSKLLSIVSDFEREEHLKYKLA